MIAVPESLSHVQISSTFHAVLYNIQRPFLKDCLWGFFSVNVILLQTSLWKCHLATLFISSPALFSIIHHFPLEGSHTQGERLFPSRTYWSVIVRLKGRLFWMFWRSGVMVLMLFAQPWSPVIEDSPPFPTPHCYRGVNHVCRGERRKLQFWCFCLLYVKVLKVTVCVGWRQRALDTWNDV